MLFKNLFKAPVDYATEMDALQFAREAKKKATAHLPVDSSTWTDEQWAIEDRWEAKVPPLENPDCICKGIVTSHDGTDGWVTTRLRLDPAPRHFAIPKEVMILAYMSMHSRSDFLKMLYMSVGDRVEVRGIFFPPILYLEKEGDAGPGEYFRLKESREYRNRRGF